MVSMGKDGCFYLDRTGRAMRVKGEPVRQVVNATGAGDAFVGGLVYAQLQGLSPEETMLFSTAAARMAIAHQNTINPNISAQNVWDTVQRDRLVVENGNLCGSKSRGGRPVTSGPFNHNSTNRKE